MTAEVRAELARAEAPEVAERIAEAAALLRCAGVLEVRGGDPPVAGRVVSTPVGAVARRLHRTLVDDVGVRPGVEVHRPSGLRQDVTYRLWLPLPPSAGGSGPWDLGLIDADGRPLGDVPPAGTGPLLDRGWVRGAAMATLSVSAPQRAVHLEIAMPGPRLADDLVQRLARLGARGAHHIDAGDRSRVVLKSGEQVGSLLARLGAHQAFLDRDLRRLERMLRAQANRAANADRANLDRAATAAARQAAQVHQALDVLDTSGLPDQVREAALARLANPGASLGELGALLDPPVGRATVHRRLARLVALADEATTQHPDAPRPSP